MSCSHDECPNEIAWRPVLVVRHTLKSTPHKIRFKQLGYCDGHRDAIQVENMLSDEGLTKIEKFLRERGLGKVTKKHTVITWEKMTDEEIRDLAQRQHRTTSPETDLAF